MACACPSRQGLAGAALFAPFRSLPGTKMWDTSCCPCTTVVVIAQFVVLFVTTPGRAALTPVSSGVQTRYCVVRCSRRGESGGGARRRFHRGGAGDAAGDGEAPAPRTGRGAAAGDAGAARPRPIPTAVGGRPDQDLAGVALLLVAVGIYGVTAPTVARRRRRWCGTHWAGRRRGWRRSSCAGGVPIRCIYGNMRSWRRRCGPGAWTRAAGEEQGRGE
jgi:hypothetical protein